MPEIRKIEMPVSHMRSGDRIVGPDFTSGNAQVIDLSRKTVWTTVTFGKSFDADTEFIKRLRNDYIVEVEREVPTEAEEEARKLAYTVDRLRTLVKEWTSDPTTGLRKTLDAFDSSSHLEAVSHWDLDRFLSRQATYKIGVNLRALVERMPTLEQYASEDEDHQLVTAVAITLLDCEDRLRRHHRDPLSRSTSITSNIYEDLDIWACAEFVDKLRWYDMGQVRARAAELRDKKDY